VTALYASSVASIVILLKKIDEEILVMSCLFHTNFYE